MKVTKAQLKQIIKEELGKVMEGSRGWGTFELPGGPEADIQHAIQMLKEVDHLTGEVAKSATQMLEEYGVQAAEQAIQMLEAEEDTTGQFYIVIRRLETALSKKADDASHDKATLDAAAALGLDPADYPAPGELEAAIEQRM